MNERLKKYLDAMFSSYEHSQAVAELKGAKADVSKVTII
jgi:hypothetical protein